LSYTPGMWDSVKTAIFDWLGLKAELLENNSVSILIEWSWSWGGGP